MVTEVHPPGTPSGPLLAELVCQCGGSSEFPWAVVGADAIGSIAAEVGLAVRRLEPLPHRRTQPRRSVPAPFTPAGDRWAAVLVEDAA